MLPVPEGFEPHFRKSPLTDPWEPIYSRKLADKVIVGLRLAEPHTNSRGLVHGGLISALADNAMGLSCWVMSPAVPGLVTISLSIDFIGSAKIGQWLQIEPAVIRMGRSIGFVQCLVTADGEICARGSATFRALREQ